MLHITQKLLAVHNFWHIYKEPGTAQGIRHTKMSKEEPPLSENSISWPKQNIKIEHICVMNKGMCAMVLWNAEKEDLTQRIPRRQVSCVLNEVRQAKQRLQ